MKAHQFTLQQLLLLTTVLCPLLALPGGPLALLVVFCWVVVVGVFVGVYMLSYRPLYVAIAGRRWAEVASRRRSPPAGGSRRDR